MAEQDNPILTKLEELCAQYEVVKSDGERHQKAITELGEKLYNLKVVCEKDLKKGEEAATAQAERDDAQGGGGNIEKTQGSRTMFDTTDDKKLLKEIEDFVLLALKDENVTLPIIQRCCQKDCFPCMSNMQASANGETQKENAICTWNNVIFFTFCLRCQEQRLRRTEQTLSRRMGDITHFKNCGKENCRYVLVMKTDKDKVLDTYQKLCAALKLNYPLVKYRQK